MWLASVSLGTMDSFVKQVNMACRPGGHYWDYYPCAKVKNANHWNLFDDRVPDLQTNCSDLNRNEGYGYQNAISNNNRITMTS